MRVLFSLLIFFIPLFSYADIDTVGQFVQNCSFNWDSSQREAVIAQTLGTGIQNNATSSVTAIYDWELISTTGSNLGVAAYVFEYDNLTDYNAAIAAGTSTINGTQIGQFVFQGGNTLGSREARDNINITFVDSKYYIIVQYWNFIGSGNATVALEGSNTDTYPSGEAISWHQVGAASNEYDIYDEDCPFVDLAIRLIGVGDFTASPQLTSGFVSAYDTRFLSLEYSSTSTVSFEVDYIIDEDEHNSSVSEWNPTLVQFSWINTASTSLFSQAESITPVTYSTSSVLTTIPALDDGFYTLRVRFSNENCVLNETVGTEPTGCPFPDAYIYTDFEISGGVVVASTTPEFYTGQFLDDINTRSCGITKISDCLIIAAAYMFVYSDESVDNLITSFQSFLTVLPFSVFATVYSIFEDAISTYSMTDATLTLDLTGTVLAKEYTILSALSTESIITSAGVTTLRNVSDYLLWILAVLGWFFYALTLFNRHESGMESSGDSGGTTPNIKYGGL